MKKATTPSAQPLTNRRLRSLKENSPFLLMILPAVLVVFLFNYMPIYAQTNVDVSWENVSESVYSQQKNLIFGNAENRPDAIYHAGMSAGEIIKYAKRNMLVPISEYLEYRDHPQGRNPGHARAQRGGTAVGSS